MEVVIFLTFILQDYVAGDVPCQEDCTLFCLSCMVLCNSPRNSAYKAALQDKFGNILRHARYGMHDEILAILDFPDVSFILFLFQADAGKVLARVARSLLMRTTYHVTSYEFLF